MEPTYTSEIDPALFKASAFYLSAVAEEFMGMSVSPTIPSVNLHFDFPSEEYRNLFNDAVKCFAK
jgi:hypothetical protein